jgi:hypothetical protein
MTKPASRARTPRKTSTEQPSLPANRAFVVQFALPAAGGASDSGRVEHVASGEATQFDSCDQLRRFVVRVLAQLRQRPR